MKKIFLIMLLFFTTTIFAAKPIELRYDGPGGARDYIRINQFAFNLHVLARALAEHPDAEKNAQYLRGVDDRIWVNNHVVEKADLPVDPALLRQVVELLRKPEVIAVLRAYEAEFDRVAYHYGLDGRSLAKPGEYLLGADHIGQARSMQKAVEGQRVWRDSQNQAFQDEARLDSLLNRLQTTKTDMGFLGGENAPDIKAAIHWLDELSSSKMMPTAGRPRKGRAGGSTVVDGQAMRYSWPMMP